MSLKRIKQRAGQDLTVKPPSVRPGVVRLREDGWQNTVTSLGVAGADKRMAGDFYLTQFTQEQAEQLWRSDPFAARSVELVPNEMTREGWLVATDGDETDFAKKISAHHDDLGVAGALNEVLKYKRAYGGGAILLGADDGQRDWGRPLDEERVKSFDYLTTLTPRELKPVVWYEDPRAPKFGLPKLYLLTPDVAGNVQTSGLIIHESRILRFAAPQTSRRSVRMTPNLWGDSVFVRVMEVIRDVMGAFGGSFALINDFAQAVLKIKGLAEMIASEDPADQNRFRARVRAFDYTRSTVRTALLDADGEEFARTSTPVTGLPELLDKSVLLLAAVLDTPVTLLMGQAPAGLNATGASDIRFFYDRIAAQQRTEAKPQINRLISLSARALGLAEPENWAVVFNPLWQLDGTQEADRRLKNAQADQVYFNMGSVSPHEFRESRFGGDEYGNEIHLDADTQDALDAPDLTDEGQPKPLNTPRISTSGPPEPAPEDQVPPGKPAPTKKTLAKK